MNERAMPPNDDQHKPRKRKRLTPDGFVWYRRFPHKALAGFRGLNPEQRGVYCTLIELCYVERGPIADDDMANARACDCDVRKFRRIKAELLELERLEADTDAGTLFDARAVRELVNAEMLSEKQSRRGKVGARKRWGKKAPVVSLALVRAEKEDRPDDRPHVGVIISPKSDPFPNEINGPGIANRKEKNKNTNQGSETPSAGAARSASPSLTGGEPRNRKTESRREALDALAALRSAKAGATDTQSEEGSEGTGEAAPAAPGDRKAVRT